MKAKDLYLDIIAQLEKKADPELASLEKYYHKTPGHRSYGLRTPEIRELIKRYKSSFSHLDLEQKLELARMFFKSGFSEQATFGNTILEISVKSLTPSHFSFLEDIADHLNNWASTDWFCIGTLQPLLKKYPQETLNLLRKWNKSENVWKRRASVVTFTRKIGMSGEFTDESLKLCDHLIWDKEDLVQKGVGWALKDNMRGAKKKVLEYVKSQRRKGVSSVITLYAIRDLKGKEREGVLKIKPDRKLERA